MSNSDSESRRSSTRQVSLRRSTRVSKALSNSDPDSERSSVRQSSSRMSARVSKALSNSDPDSERSSVRQSSSRRSARVSKSSRSSTSRASTSRRNSTKPASPLGLSAQLSELATSTQTSWQSIVSYVVESLPGDQTVKSDETTSSNSDSDSGPSSCRSARNSKSARSSTSRRSSTAKPAPPLGLSAQLSALATTSQTSYQSLSTQLSALATTSQTSYQSVVTFLVESLPFDSSTSDQTMKPDETTLAELVRLGSGLMWWEIKAAYALPLLLSIAPVFQSLFFWNLMCQVTLFLLVVQLPLFLTGRMSYVDIGWPSGLVVLAVNCINFGDGWIFRRYLMGGCLALHGGRMALGALVVFFPYDFPEELSRYQFAKQRWTDIHKLPANLWALKSQQETFTQCFANSAILAVPFFVTCSNPSEKFHPLEIIGVICWGLSWVFENVADGQKQHFLNTCKRLRKSETSQQKKDELKQACLGMAPFDGYEYYLWTLSRHPNYLGEYLCWCSFCLAALPSVFALQSAWLTCVCMLGLYLVVRFFYDCLVNWTGAEPAEFGSLTRRPNYAEYQSTTPVLFPSFVPFIDGHMEKGWPYPELLLKRNQSISL